MSTQLQLKNISINININPLNAELNPICHLLALLGGAAIVVVRSLRVNIWRTVPSSANVFHTSELLASIHSSVTGYHE